MTTVVELMNNLKTAKQIGMAIPPNILACTDKVIKWETQWQNSKKQTRITGRTLMVSTLAMADAVTKLLIEKGIITDAELKQKLLEERAV